MGIITDTLEHELTKDRKKDRHTFSIYVAHGVKKSGLIRSWCHEIEIELNTLVVHDNAMHLYNLYQEQEVKDHMNKWIVKVKCIVSFQVYNDGEQFAVARLWKPRKVGV